MHPAPTPPYSPLYFLAALGAGGLAVTFFLYLMFWVPHPGQPVPVFEDIFSAFLNGGASAKAMIATAATGIALFLALMVKLLVWNVVHLLRFQQGEDYGRLMVSNAQTQMMAVPLTLAMAVNGGFILGLVFVPGLWSIVEYLFPAAMIAFLAIGAYGLRIYGGFLTRALVQGGIDCAANNSFAQALPAFAFAMVSVGLAAPAAMSLTPLTAGVSLILSSFFLALAVLIGLVAVILGFRSMMENGVAREAAPTLMILVPVITVLAIAVMRQNHGLHVHFGAHTDKAGFFTLLTPLLMMELAFVAFGAKILRDIGYMGQYVTGPDRSAGSYALVCPGVALSVLWQFWVNKALVGIGLLAKFSVAYWVVSAPAIVLQLAVIWLVWRLNAKHFGTGRGAEPLAA